MEKENDQNNRRALLVGCNYPNTQYELHGCVNDVIAMRDTLVSGFGFEPNRVRVMTDEPGSGQPSMPTGENIKRALGEMIDEAKTGDVLYFHYSGHGTRIPSKSHFMGRDEAIVPSDFNLITDVDFRHLVNRLPKGASLTILSDSCHSGGLIDKEKQQVGPTSPVSVHRSSLSVPPAKHKSIPLASLLSHLSSLTGIATADVATHMLELFGGESSLKFRQLIWPGISKPDEGILLSGCQADETSADLPDGTAAGGKARGAFSSAVQVVLEQGPPERRLSNREVVAMAREVLSRDMGILGQHPCLYCSDENVDAVFLGKP